MRGRMDRRLIIEHIPRLRRYARALVGDRYVADDLVQDTLERAWNKFYLWRPGSDLRAWLFTIMHNVFVNQLKARKITSDVEIDDTFAAPVPGATRSATAATAFVSTAWAWPSARCSAPRRT